MELTEKRLDGETVYNGVIVNVTLDNIELCDGSRARREVVHHPGGVTVLPVDSDGNCYVVKQYRYPVGRLMLETPAGKLDGREDHLLCAKRELSEETGLTADSYIDLGCFYTSPGYSDEIIHLYLATGLHHGESHPDEGEFLNIEKMSFDALYALVMEGSIADAKTALAVLKAKEYLDGRV